MRANLLHSPARATRGRRGERQAANRPGGRGGRDDGGVVRADRRRADPPGLSPAFLGHGMETALLASVTGAALGWEDETLADLALAALLADLGMLMVPEHLRTKPGVVSRLERRELENHPRLGADALQPVARVSPLVPLVALQHHERYDGAGYPAGLSRGDIRPGAQVVAVCHRYMAAVSARNYREGIPPYQALELMQALGDALAAQSIVTAFIGAIAIYPVGTQVRRRRPRGPRPRCGQRGPTHGRDPLRRAGGVRGAGLRGPRDEPDAVHRGLDRLRWWTGAAPGRHGDRGTGRLSYPGGRGSARGAADRLRHLTPCGPRARDGLRLGLARGAGA